MHPEDFYCYDRIGNRISNELQTEYKLSEICNNHVQKIKA